MRQPFGGRDAAKKSVGADPLPDAAGDGPNCLVVMYHYVHDHTPALDSNRPEKQDGVRGLTQAQFSAQLDRLCAELEPIDWPTFYAWTAGRGCIPDRSFLLTFDDGLADHAETVRPILDRRGLRGVFFVPGAVLTAHTMLPAHAVHLLLSRLGEQDVAEKLRRHLADCEGGGKWATTLETAMAQVGDGGSPPDALAMYDYESPARATLKYFLTMTLPIDLRNQAIATLFERHVGSSPRWARHWYLTWDDLVRLQAAGHTIGGHGYAHEPYGRLTPAQRHRDLARAAGVLREGLGHDLRPFSYPYGSAADDIAQAARDAGFVHGFDTQPRRVAHGDDPFRLPRVDTIRADALLTGQPICPRA